MKKLFGIFSAVLLTVLFTVNSFALTVNDSGYPYVYDGAGLLTGEEENTLDEYIADFRNNFNFDIVIVTTNNLNGKSAMAYADDYYDYKGFGYGKTHDGCLLLIHMDENRGYWISTTGLGMEIINDGVIDELGNAIVPYLKDGDYYKAVSIFAGGVEYYVSQSTSNGIVHNDNDDFDYEQYKPTALSGFKPLYLAIGAGVGLIAALITTAILKGQLKSVRFKSSASDYYVNDSLQMTGAYDRFAGRRISRVKIERESSSGGSHTGSSGTSHGGGGGSF